MCKIDTEDIKKLSGARFRNFEINAKVKIKGVSTDSRRIGSGEVFWVLRGDRFDGHDFVEQVQEKALFSVIADDQAHRFEEKPFPLALVPDTLNALQELAGLHRSRFNIPLLALTGSNGKTTVKEMIYTVLSSKMNVHKTEGNLNNHIGCPLTLLKLNRKHQAAVIELGSNHPGEIKTLSEIARPSQALVTNVGAAHLEFFGDTQTVAKEKLSLFGALPANGIIYKNLDDPFIQKFDCGGRTTVSFSRKEKADARGELLEIDAKGRARFILNGSREIHLQVPGKHNVQNALAAAAVGLRFGLSETEIGEALEAYASTDKRMQVIEKSGVTFLNDTYNANPDSTSAALTALKEMSVSGRIFVVLGDMLELGSGSGEWHSKIIAQALELNPAGVFLFGSAMRRAAERTGGVLVFDSRHAIALELKERLRSGDLVLLKGSRGMRMEKIIEEFN